MTSLSFTFSLSGNPVILGGLNIILSTEDCHDGVDNDGDGLIDGQDPDCVETMCDDGIDNNSNGYADCDDPNCQEYWPLCVHADALASISPQQKCQGELIFTESAVVKCEQRGGLLSHVYYSYPNSSLGNVTGVDLSADPLFTSADTMINCGDYHSDNFGSHKYLKVGNRQASPEGEYYALQRFTLSNDTVAMLPIVQIRLALLLIKGGGFGTGNASVYAGYSSWSDDTVMCSDIANVTDLFDPNCTHVLPSVAVNEYGWALVNITQIFLCQMVESGQQIINLLWMQESDQSTPQVWHSSESPTAPKLVVYYDSS